jgi:hypothetical protein
MNFLKRYSCVSHHERDAFEDATSVISDLGFDEESDVYKVPKANELGVELFRLMNLHSTEESSAAVLDSLERIYMWTLVACDERHTALSRIFVKQQVVPTLLYLIRGLLKKTQTRDTDICLEKAAQIIYHCTSFHDRSTIQLEKYSKDMNIQLVKHNGVDTLVQAMERYRLDDSIAKRSILNMLWTILMNVATCENAVALLKFPKAMFERQEELLLDTMAADMMKAEAGLPVFWMESMLIALHRLVKFDGKYNMHTRQIMAQNRILNKLLVVLLNGKKKLATRDPCVTALAMSLFQNCLVDSGFDDIDGDSVVEAVYRSRRHDELRRSIDFDLLTRVTLRGIESFPTSKIIQGQGRAILEELPPVYGLLVCHDDTVIVSSPCSPDGQHTKTVWKVVSSVSEPCWHCQPTELRSPCT